MRRTGCCCFATCRGARRCRTGSSLFGGWRLTIKGKSEEARTNWGRLDANRKAFAIVTRLERIASGGEKNAGDADLAVAREDQAFGEPVLERLAMLRRLVAERDWDTVNRVLVSLRYPLRRLDPKLAERLTRYSSDRSFTRHPSSISTTLNGC